MTAPASPRHLSDESKLAGRADGVFMPACEEEVVDAILTARRDGKTLTIGGARTGLCGGSVPFGGYVLSLERMNKILGVGRLPDGRFFVRAEPCVTVRQLNEALAAGLPGVGDATPGAAEEMRRAGRMVYPVDPTELDGSVGGNAATDASGPRSMKYGSARRWIAGIRIALADGSVVDVPRGRHFAAGRHFDATVGGKHIVVDAPPYDFNTKVKNSAGLYSADGMDLIDLFIGSEGILGAIVRVDLLVTGWHPAVSNVMFFPDDRSALAFVAGMAEAPGPELLEYLDCRSVDLVREAFRGDPSVPSPPERRCSAVFFDLPDDGDLMRRLDAACRLAAEHGGSADWSWAGSDEADAEAMFAFRHAVPAAVAAHIASRKAEVPSMRKMGTDMSVPAAASDEMMAAYAEALGSRGLDYLVFGHMGSCHPHVQILLRDEEDMRRAEEAYAELAAKAVSLGGSPSAEHGIGKTKRRYLEMLYGEEGVEGIRRTKRALDPEGLLCPGNMVGP